MKKCNKILVLAFNNAKMFKQTRFTKDYVFTRDNAPLDRVKFHFYEEPLNANHISNMLHVLFGYRPIASLRGSLYNSNTYLFDKANESYIKYDLVNHKGEMLQTNKSRYNSKSMINFMYWERVKNLIGDDLYNQFTTVTSLVLGISNIEKKHTFEEVKKMLNPHLKDKRIVTLFDKLKANRKTSLCTYIDGTELSGINANPLTRLSTTKGIETAYKAYGKIYVPVNDDDIKRLEEYSSGFANILDGGMVEIDSLIDINKFSDDELIKIKNISIKTKTL